MGEKEFSAESAQEIINQIEAQEQETIKTGIITTLAKLPKEALLDEKAMAKAFNVCGKTIRRMTARYELPPPIRVGGRSLWIAGRVISWIEANAERLEKDAMKAVEKIRRYNA